MWNKNKTFILLLFISVFFYGCTNRTAEIATLQNKIQTDNEKIKQQEDKIAQLEKKQYDLSDERGNKGKELTKKLNSKSIDSLSKIIDEYYYGIDGAYSEQYGYVLYDFYKKEGMEKLIEILNNKDATTIEGVSLLLLGELEIEKNEKEIESIIEKLNSINSEKISDKKRYIVLRLLEQSYLAKIMIK